ncbi:MAG: hypothetical protein JWQ71_3283 [Pedosphaera sp.]|nr:hypothetical protein [Pedosphaera sp.]
MNLTLTAAYSKKLGIPNFSSHQFSITVCTELSNLADLDTESLRLYSLLQACVDREIQKTGYSPQTYGNGNQFRTARVGDWNCSEKQKRLIHKVVSDRRLRWYEAEASSHQQFGKGIRSLTKAEASALIESLFRKPIGPANGSMTETPESNLGKV